MVDSVAFLRGINVGGHKKVKMLDACKAFESIGLKGVTGIGASGNMLFDSNGMTHHEITMKLKGKLKALAGGDVCVILRTISQIKAMVKADPFKGKVVGATPYVTFFLDPIVKRPAVPLKTSIGDVEVFKFTSSEAFSLNHPMPGGRNYPNGFLESKLKAVCTTRNWSVVLAVASKS